MQINLDKIVDLLVFSYNEGFNHAVKCLAMAKETNEPEQLKKTFRKMLNDKLSEEVTKCIK